MIPISSYKHNESNSEQIKTSLQEIAAPVKDKKRVNPKLMRATILQLCSQNH
jgi:hypothetical protein